MTWTAPNPPPTADGPLVGADRPMLEAFLAYERATLLRICAGLSAEQLALRPAPPSNLSLLGLVRHLAKVERTWFRERIAGETLEPLYGADRGKDGDFDDLDPDRAEEDFARFEQQCRLADEVLAGRSLDDTFDLHGETYSVRLVLIHMVREYARHNGHADLLREHIDGTTGI